MPDKKISQLTAAGALADADMTPVVQSSVTKKSTLSAVYTYIASKLVGAISTVLTSNLTASKLVSSNGSGKLAASSFIDTDIQSGATEYAAATGTDTYAITLAPVPAAYAAGNCYKVKFANANTGASTINVNTLGAKAIKKNASVALAAGDIVAGKIYKLTYDGTNFQIESNDSASLFEVGAGADSLKTKNATSVTGAEAIAIGKDVSSQGDRSVAIGRQAITAADRATALGANSQANVQYSTNLSFPICNLKSGGFSYTNVEKLYLSGAEVVLMTDEIDLKTTGDYQIDIGLGAAQAKFYPNEVGLILTTIGGTLTAQPFIRAGINGTLAKLLAVVQTTTLSALVGTRQRKQTLLSDAGETTLTAGVTTAATGSSTIKGRFYFKGLFIENE